jgi:BatD DUF11 like domain
VIGQLVISRCDRVRKEINRRIHQLVWFRFVLLFAAMTSVVTDASALTINVNSDRNPVRLNESFTLTFTADQSPDGEPDFTVLEENFEILNQSQSSNISIINGDFRKSVNWTLSLIAKKAGNLAIPPVSFGQDRSEQISIEVLGGIDPKSDEDAEILLEVSAQPENPYVQAQVIYTVQFLRRVEVAQASLNEPVLENSIIQKLGDDRSFSVRRNGQQYAVTERKYAIFPQESGPATIAPLELKADVMTSGRMGFFNRSSTRLRRIQSPAVVLDVRPVPAQFTGNFWLPAERIVLAEQWSTNPPAVTVGEPLTRTVKLTASGALLSLLPEFGKLRFKGQPKGAVKQYPDQPVLEEKKYYSGIVGSREQKTAIIPSSPGRLQAEALEIAWWNTRTDRLELATLPGAVIEALPATENTGPTSGAVSSPTGGSQNDDAKNSLSVNSTGVEPADGIWFWIAVMLALGWSGTLILLAVKKFASKSNKHRGESSETASVRRAIRAVKKACRSQEPIMAKNALIAWGGLRWPHAPPKNLTALAALCIGDLGTEIQNLNRLLYSRDRAAWNGAACWKAFSHFTGQGTDSKEKTSKVDLEPLFKA